MEIILPAKGQAHELMGHLCQLLSDYGSFTVADLAELIDAPLPGDPKYGWTDVKDVEIFISRTQTHIRFPPPTEVG